MLDHMNLIICLQQRAYASYLSSLNQALQQKINKPGTRKENNLEKSQVQHKEI